MAKLDFWNDFCRRYQVLERSVPLFEEVDGYVATFSHGWDFRLMLQRSGAMNTLVISEVTKVLDDFRLGSREYEGVIYMMFWPDGDQVLPLYIGKSEKYGRGGGNLSENIKGIRNRSSKFARWSYDYKYHMGDLSSWVCPGHRLAARDEKYRRWADRLFDSWPVVTPQLHRETRFWLMAWPRGATGVWTEYGPTSLTFLEYQLIGVASDVFPDTLLNDEGVNRS